jgi:hypothetical protein
MSRADPIYIAVGMQTALLLGKTRMERPLKK